MGAQNNKKANSKIVNKIKKNFTCLDRCYMIDTFCDIYLFPFIIYFIILLRLKLSFKIIRLDWSIMVYDVSFLWSINQYGIHVIWLIYSVSLAIDWITDSLLFFSKMDLKRGFSCYNENLFLLFCKSVSTVCSELIVTRNPLFPDFYLI